MTGICATAVLEIKGKQTKHMETWLPSLFSHNEVLKFSDEIVRVYEINKEALHMKDPVSNSDSNPMRTAYKSCHMSYMGKERPDAKTSAASKY